ncbi:ABC transporter substrate-binding protein [Acuticoccus sp. I52.16.1]|uniref:ABC transporter substrate-binding protein n=1 Tax=Acuticoccus sp. I52.16.1 TaxID=2928472 RepID=UPI001FD5DFE1|nr:ABC transporter substrate-binding protein [Acuticoccus sp. I52.16.1]UOM32815.1 ABC transporter substrate-binding protein [Acuticoccus sp. I52.16.1]
MRLFALPAVLAATLALAGPATAQTRGPDVADWPAVLAAAEGQTVDWYAWGGETHINDYIAWVGDEVAARYGVTLNQVKLADTAEAVARVLAEKTAGENEDGAVDLVWINGENFVAMQENGLLRPDPWAEALPNRPLVDMDLYGAAIDRDFGVSVKGQESPWGRAQLVTVFDAARTPEPPRSLDELIAFAEANPGRFTYPQPPNFTGTTFLKQLLLDLVPDREILYAPAGDGAETLVRDTLIPVLQRLHPNLWRKGAAFPAGVAEVRRLYADGELLLALTGNPSDAVAGVNDGLLPPESRVAAFAGGSIGNVHFVAIPFNAADQAGALVVANFLLSPEAQARKADPDVWGDPTVLAVARLPEADRALFDEEVGVDAPTLAEPHVSWTAVIERVWDEAFLR